MSAVLPFPPRDAGRVLASAMQAAEAATRAEARRLRDALFEPWGARSHDPGPQMTVEAAAFGAAAPILRALTADTLMVEIVAYAMAGEALLRLRKGGDL